MNRLLEPKDPHTGKYPFRYVPAAATDVRKTFERIKKELKEKNVPLS